MSSVNANDTSFRRLEKSVKDCRLCKAHLEPRPVLQIHPEAKILIAGQAPGIRVHRSGTPFDDPSGTRLRAWLNLSSDVFYDPGKIAILPMGFCYPGTGSSGDLPPRPECADTWRKRILDQLVKIKLTLVIGQYAQKWHITNPKKNLTETIRNWESYAPQLFPLPHPSPRNNIWLKKNPWFEDDVLPALKSAVSMALQND